MSLFINRWKLSNMFHPFLIRQILTPGGSHLHRFVIRIRLLYFIIGIHHHAALCRHWFPQWSSAQDHEIGFAGCPILIARFHDYFASGRRQIGGVMGRNGRTVHGAAPFAHVENGRFVRFGYGIPPNTPGFGRNVQDRHVGKGLHGAGSVSIRATQHNRLGFPILVVRNNHRRCAIRTPQQLHARIAELHRTRHVQPNLIQFLIHRFPPFFVSIIPHFLVQHPRAGVQPLGVFPPVLRLCTVRLSQTQRIAMDKPPFQTIRHGGKPSVGMTRESLREECGLEPSERVTDREAVTVMDEHHERTRFLARR
mmetsp:Transcript_45180/g.52916  ORF Transcript_45180/g.52916 Transcript_45180/m.52916 type:complete len:309 (+) Transcript_45180:136-1062(+)